MTKKEREPLLGRLALTKKALGKERLRARLLDDDEVERMLAEVEDDDDGSSEGKARA